MNRHAATLGLSASGRTFRIFGPSVDETGLCRTPSVSALLRTTRHTVNHTARCDVPTSVALRMWATPGPVRSAEHSALIRLVCQRLQYVASSLPMLSRASQCSRLVVHHAVICLLAYKQHLATRMSLCCTLYVRRACEYTHSYNNTCCFYAKLKRSRPKNRAAFSKPTRAGASAVRFRFR